MHLKVAVTEFTLYLATQKDKDGNEEVVGGIDFEFLKILAHILNFTYEFTFPADSEWGRLKEDGTWSGMVGMLDRKDADMAISCITLSYDRSKVTDYAYPYHMDYDTFSIKKAGTIPRNFFYVYTFGLYVWMCMAIVFVICSVLLACIERFESSTKRKEHPHLLMSAFLAAENLVGSQEFKVSAGKRISKAFFLITTMHIEVLKFCFAGLLLSLLMSPITEDQIQTIEQLAKASQIGRVKVTSYKDTQLATDLTKAETNPLRYLGENLRKDPDSAAAGDEDVIERISNGYAFMDIRDYVDIVISEAGIGDNIFISTDSLRVAHIAILFKEGFCCTKEFDKIMFRYYQSGIYQKLLQDQLFKLRLKERIQAIPQEDVRPIAMKDVLGVLLILAVGLALSTLALICEKIANRN